MLKGPISDQVTEKCCGCFLALTIVSQWMRVGAVWCGLLRRVRQSCAAEGGRVRCRRRRFHLADVYMCVCACTEELGVWSMVMVMVYSCMSWRVVS